jgi:phosphoglycerate kinase
MKRGGLLVTLCLLIVTAMGFNLKPRKAPRAVLQQSQTGGATQQLSQQKGRLFKESLVQLPMASGSIIETKVVPAVEVLRRKVVEIAKILWTPFGKILLLIKKLMKLMDNSVKKTKSGGVVFETPITISEIKSSARKFSVSAIKNKVMRSTAESAAKDYVKLKLKEIDDAEKLAKAAKKMESGRWPPIVTIPPPSTKGKKSVASLKKVDLEGKRVLVRCDLNVPLDGELQVTDDTRLRGCTSTIKYLMDKGAKVMLTSHLGRPKGNGPEDKAKFSLAPVVPRLSELLSTDVTLVSDCVGPAVSDAVAKMSNGQVILLENSRFYKEEEGNDRAFCAQLSKNADIYVNDAFGTAHRAHATTAGIATWVKPAVAGFLLQKELDYLQGAVDVPKRPFAAIVGGSKVSSKISVIEAMLNKVDKLILGGGMVFTFLKARGVPVGSSLVENDQLQLARRLEKLAKMKGVELILADDVVVADKFAADAATKVVNVGDIPYGWMGLDIGPKTLAKIETALSDCKTVIWNGPMGVFEMEAFSKGTFGVAEYLAQLTDKGCTTIIGGGDSVAAVEKAGLADRMSHISTGGGASLELLEGKVLPGVDALDQA